MSERNAPTFTVDMGKKCIDCRDGGAQPNGLCFACLAKAFEGKKMKTEHGERLAKEARKRLREFQPRSQE